MCSGKTLRANADNEIRSSEKETALFTRFSLRLLCFCFFFCCASRPINTHTHTQKNANRLQGIAGLPGPIGIDGVPGLPGQKGEKVRLTDEVRDYHFTSLLYLRENNRSDRFLFERVKKGLAYKVFKVLVVSRERRCIKISEKTL